MLQSSNGEQARQFVSKQAPSNASSSDSDGSGRGENSSSKDGSPEDSPLAVGEGREDNREVDSDSEEGCRSARGHKGTSQHSSNHGSQLPFMARYVQRVVPRLAALQQPKDERLRQTLAFFQKVRG